MGYHHCDACDEATYGETAACEGCGLGNGDGVTYCLGCAGQAPCDSCGTPCCSACCDARFECCGKVLCGAGRDASDCPEDCCAHRHEECDAPWPGCGHTRCSEQPEARGCAKCAVATEAAREAGRVAADRKRMQAIADDEATSASLRAVLRRWCADPDFLARDAAELDRTEREANADRRKRRER
jgi:hypothetical protein